MKTEKTLIKFAVLPLHPACGLPEGLWSATVGEKDAKLDKSPGLTQQNFPCVSVLLTKLIQMTLISDSFPLLNFCCASLAS